jgi:hypothetical protein
MGERLVCDGDDPAGIGNVSEYLEYRRCGILVVIFGWV